MANTYNFADGKDFSLGGAWSDDEGNPICSWSWDAAARKLIVTCGNREKRKTLPSVEANLSEHQLRKRLPRLALDLAEQIKGR